MNGTASPQELVQGLRQGNSDILAAVIATADGFCVAADTAADIPGDMLAALGADLLGRSSRSAGEFSRGVVDELYLRGPSGYMLVARGGQDQALICLANPGATIGLLLVDLRRAAAQLA